MAGLVLVCSTPISGFVSYALVSILLGETRLEGPSGLTPAGWVAISSPVTLGAGLVLWSFVNPWAPRRRTMAALLALGAALLAGVGLWSTVASAGRGDASIGGGLLVLASIPIGVGAVVLSRLRRGPVSSGGASPLHDHPGEHGADEQQGRPHHL